MDGVDEMDHTPVLICKQLRDRGLKCIEQGQFGPGSLA
jgi:hypothetical protein